MLLLDESPVSEQPSAFRAPVGLVVERGARGELLLSFPLSTRKPPQATLTPVEWDTLRDLALGLSNAAIASRRGVSIRTVANQIAQLFRKLGVHSRLEAALVAGHWTPPEKSAPCDSEP